MMPPFSIYCIIRSQTDQGERENRFFMDFLCLSSTHKSHFSSRRSENCLPDLKHTVGWFVSLLVRKEVLLASLCERKILFQLEIYGHLRQATAKRTGWQWLEAQLQTTTNKIDTVSGFCFWNLRRRFVTLTSSSIMCTNQFQTDEHGPTSVPNKPSRDRSEGGLGLWRRG